MSPASRFLSALRGGRPGSWLSLVALLLLVGAGAYQWQRGRGFETTDDAFVEGTLSHLAPEIAGRVVEILISGHAEVSAGQTLVRLDTAEAETHLARARADLAAAHNQMNSAEAAAAASDAEGRAAKVEAWRSGRELERVRRLAESGAANTQQLDAASATHDAAEARVHALALRAKAERGVLGNEAPLRQAEAALREAELELEHCELRAPFDAIVGRKNVHLGDIVRRGQALMALRRREPSWVVANFKETQLWRMRPGAPVTIHVDAFPEHTWWGHVESFSPASGAKYALIPPEPAAGNFTKVVQRIPVKIVLDEVSNGSSRQPVAAGDTQPTLAIGLSAEVSVDVR
ncbi:MAG: HlyD family secretion protein [Deltaproteobacteria bacterium]|nr:HlyD family secretion protein [Deltaproteobacteria bacterium]MBW2359277.1 HlyD family secretion protein [Deltaproteobacteria bacterium]